MLYLKSCGLYVVLVFCVTAFGWQAFRIYSDVWLRGWTDNNKAAAAAAAMQSLMITDNNDENISSSTHDNVSFFIAYTTHINLNYIFVSPTSSSLQELYYFNVYGALSMICILLAIISTPIGQWAGFRACQRIHEQLLAALMDKSLNFFQITPLGRVMNRFSNDINVIDKV